MSLTESVVRIDKLQGIRNTLRPERTELGALELANNVDIDDTNTIERREGYAKVADFTNITAAYCANDQQRMYIVDNGDLKLVRPDFTTQVIKSGLPSSRMYWQEDDDVIFYSGKGENGSGIIFGDNMWRPLGVPTPLPPSVTAIPGTLPAGQYQVVCTNLSPEKMESGSPTPIAIELLNNQAIRIDHTPDPNHTANIYISSTNGKTLYRAMTNFSGGVFIFDGPLTKLAYKLEVEQINTYPMPDNCDRIEVHEGRLYAARFFPETDQSVLWWSQPLWFHLFDVADDYVMFGDQIRGMASTDDGLVVVTEKSISVIKDGARNVLAWVGCPDGYPIVETLTREAYVFSERGVYKFPGFQNLTEGKVSVAPGSDCFVAYMMRKGREKLVVMTNNAGFPNNQYVE